MAYQSCYSLTMVLILQLVSLLNFQGNGILTMTSPHYPKSNGLVERMIQAVKKTLKKTFKQDEDLYLALLVLFVLPQVSVVSRRAVVN